MRLFIDSCGKNTCPICKVTLDIESSYEERTEDCEGPALCPSCDKPIRIESVHYFKIKKEER